MTRRQSFHIENTGTATARQVNFYFVVPGEDGDQLVRGFLDPNGFLRPGEGAKIETKIVVPASRQDALRGVVVCIDAQEAGYGWDITTSRLKRWHRRFWHKGNKEAEEVFKKFFRRGHTKLGEAPYEITRTT
jgi:hypothetical protein